MSLSKRPHHLSLLFPVLIYSRDITHCLTWIWNQTELVNHRFVSSLGLFLLQTCRTESPGYQEDSLHRTQSNTDLLLKPLDLDSGDRAYIIVQLVNRLLRVSLNLRDNGKHTWGPRVQSSGWAHIKHAWGGCPRICGNKSKATWLKFSAPRDLMGHLDQL